MIITDLFKAILYTAGLAPKTAIKGIITEDTGDKLTYLQTIFTSIMRKIIFASAGIYLSKLVASGLITQGDSDVITEAVLAVAVIVGTATWSKILVPFWNNRIWPWIQSKVGPVT